jgi:hypothetical protein
MVPVRQARVRPGNPHQALVLLPDRALASVYLQYTYMSGHITLSRIAIINHNPDKVTLFFTKAQVYVDDGEPLKIVNYRPLDPDQHGRDLRFLKDLPAGAEDPKGKWLVPARRYVSRDEIRGPTVVLFYSVGGLDGFVKVRYRTLWDLTG